MASWTDFPWFDTPQERARDEYERGRIGAIDNHRRKLSDFSKNYFRERDVSRRLMESAGMFGTARKTREQVLGELKEESLKRHRNWLGSCTEPFRNGYNDEMRYLTRFDTLPQMEDDW